MLISVKKNINIKIGSLGYITFKKGLYAYVGSAQNSIESRVKRHLSKNKKKYWHIDYLLLNRNVNIVDIFYKKNSNKSYEDRFANKLMKTGKPIINFGSSDSKCKSHLFKIKNRDIINRLVGLNVLRLS